jgi:hypothetical protein
MSILDRSKPIGLVVERQGSDAEAQELVHDFTSKAKPALDMLVEHIGKAAAAGDGTTLSLWAISLKGLLLDIERLLTEHKVGVVPDVRLQ